MKTNLSKLFEEFLESEQASGVVLIFCTIASISIANSYFGKGYTDFWHTKVGFEVGSIALKYSIEHWINDGLMAIFFLLIGLEIERELYIGKLSNLKKCHPAHLCRCRRYAVAGSLPFHVQLGEGNTERYGYSNGDGYCFCAWGTCLVGQ